MLPQVSDIMDLLQAERNDKLNFQDRILEQVKQSIEAHALVTGIWHMILCWIFFKDTKRTSMELLNSRMKA